VNATETAALVVQRLDRYADAWRGARVDACKATYVHGEQSEALLDLRMACLDRRLGEMDALVGALVERPTPEVVDKAVEATIKLPSLTSCNDRAALQAVVPLPPDPAVRRRITDLRADLGRAIALEDLGRYRDGRALASTVVEQSHPLAYPPLEAEALRARAELEDRDGDSKAAEATLRATLLVGAASHDDVLVARVWSDLVQVIGYALARPDEALAMRDAAEVALRRAGDPTEPQVRLWTNLAKVYLQQSKLSDAKELLGRALAAAEATFGSDDLRLGSILGPLSMVAAMEGDYKLASTYSERVVSMCEKVLGSEHPMLAQALNNLGEIVRNMNELDRAYQYHQRALAIREHMLGPQHPSLATSLHNLAIVEREAKKLDSARAHLERALSIREAVLGAAHRDTSDTLLLLGNVRQAQAGLDDARRLYERALEAQTGSLGPEHPHLFYVLTNLGKLSLQQRRFADARREYARAVELVRKGRGPDHRELAFPLVGLAKALVELGRTNEAKVAASEALAIRVKRNEPAQLVAESRFVLARAVWLFGDRTQARELADQARRGYVDSGDADVRDELAEIDAWRRTH
jgi:eukaryotic-like serine/threonine-protein kinase